MAWREVERAAAKGAALEDIVAALDVQPEVLAANRERLEKVVATGHAKFRVELAERLHREACRKGRATPLIAAAKAWLPGYTEAAEPPPAEAGVLSQLEAILDRVQARKRKGA